MAQQDFSKLNRRSFLRGLGVSMGLPALEAFHPSIAKASGSRLVATTPSGAPLRMAYLYIPNGVNVANWKPTGTGSDFTFGPTFEPIQKMRNHLQVFSGFEHLNATSGRDGAGHHARGIATFLTGQRAKKTSGAGIRLGISVDQIAAEAARDLTRIPSLELTTSGVRKSGHCDSGYSCAYQFNLSWRSKTQPMTPEANPRAVFERLFGTGNKTERASSLGQRYASKKSMLDFIQQDARALTKYLGRADQHKIDEYLTGVREIELQVERIESLGLPPDPGAPAPPDGRPTSYTQHIRLLMDMMVLAFKTDSTRISTFMLEHEGHNRHFKDIGVSEGHHNLSHHKNRADNLEKIAKIDRFYMEQYAYFLNQLENTEDIDGQSILHNSMVVYGGCISDGNRHSNKNLPITLAGHAGGAFTPGRHVNLGKGEPLTNLYVRMLQEFGVKATSFGDSTGVLKNV